MVKHNIDFCSLIPRGRVKTKLIDDVLKVCSTHSISSIAFNLTGDSYKKHIICLAKRYHIPFRIDMRVALDFPTLLILIGDGHLTFASSDNRKIEDIVKPTGKPNQDNRLYNNKLPLGEFADISITYNFDEMQILIGGEERFYSSKLPYMKAKNLGALNAEGFEIGMAVSKLSALSIKSITVTEFGDEAPVVRGAFNENPPQSLNTKLAKPTFESIISDMPEEYINELTAMDKFLKLLRPLNFKRTIDKNGGKITYLSSDFGFSYIIYVMENSLSHGFNFYIVTNGKPDTWHRKADYMEEVLNYIAKTDKTLASRIFYALNDCVGCYGSRCLAKTLYTFDGQKRLTCHGRVMLRQCFDDFNDAREFFRFFNEFIGREMAGGGLKSEKIMLKK